MRIRVVSSRDEIDTVDKDEKIVHIAFRPSNKDVLSLLKSCPDLKAIRIPPSYFKTLSDTIIMFLEMHDISLLEGDTWGHRTDVCKYLEIEPGVLDKIEELKKEGLSESNVFKRMEKETGLSKDLLQFLMKGKGNNK